MTPDLAARKVIVNAFLYYVLDAPILDDAEYDKLSEIAAAGWDQLHPDRQWALGSADALRATGHHIKFSPQAVLGAVVAYEDHFKKPAPDLDIAWRKHKGRMFTTC